MSTYKIYVTVTSPLGLDTKYLFPGSISHVVTNTYEDGDDAHLYLARVLGGHRPPSYPVGLGTHFEYVVDSFFGIGPTSDENDLEGNTSYWTFKDRFDSSQAQLGSVGFSEPDATFPSTYIPSFSAVTLDSMVSAIMSNDDSVNVELKGSTGKDTLRGSFWDDKLDGGKGADLMIGGDGYDQYWVDDKGDKLVENANEGYDTINTKFTTTLPTNFEALAGYGGGDINLTGNGGANGLSGNNGDNIIKGLAGADTISGGGGHDTLYGGTQNDYFLYVTSPTSGTSDTIKDFSAGHDKIVLSQYVFIGVSTYPPTPAPSFSKLPVNKFHASKSGLAHDSDDRITYDSDDGKLYYDPDGTGSSAHKLIAVLTGHPTLHAYDILIL